MQYWLFKSEPTTFGIDHLIKAPQQTTNWEGVRNYQVRNMLRDEIHVGDQVFFYHSNCSPPGITGIVTVTKQGYADDSAWNPKSKYFDPKSSPDHPIWFQVDIKFIKKFPYLLSLEVLKTKPALKDMILLRRGNRLSITKVTTEEWEYINNLTDKTNFTLHIQF